MTQQDETMTKEEALKQRGNLRYAATVRSGTNHLFILDLSKMPDADVSGKVEYGPFNTYYTQRFASDLEQFYNIDHSCSNFAYPFVLEMSAPGYNPRTLDLVGTNKDRLNLNFAGTRHFSMFAAAVFYMSACAQVLGKLYGRKPMEDFHKASNWPMLNCGMGGLMSPVQVIFESILYPYSYEVEDYLEAFREAADYLEADFFDFLENDQSNLNPTAYAALRKAVDTDALRKELAQQRQLFESWIQDPRTKYPLYYIEPKEIW